MRVLYFDFKFLHDATVLFVAGCGVAARGGHVETPLTGRHECVRLPYHQ